MDYKEAIERHIEECKHRIDVITDFMKENKDSNKDKCLENIETLKAAISAMQELQAIRNNGIGLECLKNIDFRKQVVEHINYMDYMDIRTNWKNTSRSALWRKSERRWRNRRNVKIVDIKITVMESAN